MGKYHLPKVAVFGTLALIADPSPKYSFLCAKNLY
jgi:hypothetical protein